MRAKNNQNTVHINVNKMIFLHFQHSGNMDASGIFQLYFKQWNVIYLYNERNAVLLVWIGLTLTH